MRGVGGIRSEEPDPVMTVSCSRSVTRFRDLMGDSINGSLTGFLCCNQQGCGARTPDTGPLLATGRDRPVHFSNFRQRADIVQNQFGCVFWLHLTDNYLPLDATSQPFPPLTWL
ncbi:hypothetical protein RRG08_010572 [Elysia crispata]|uniref:Uncharacterized protein n=1 Tax=Elysia crispata TaxID=231223 RepID=A0AAE0ZTK4_9GAST|nr:hypothetical protein RRG08_010572 [Elysia crispata]